MTLDVCIHKPSSKIISRTLPRQRVGCVETSRRSRNKFHAGRLNAMVSRATSAAKAASRVAYIGTTESRALPARNSKRVFRFGKGSAKNATYHGKCPPLRLPTLPHTQSEFGEGMTGKGTASAVPHSLCNQSAIQGRHDLEMRASARPHILPHTGNARLCACPHPAAYSIRNSGRTRSGRARLQPCHKAAL